jgi:regulator of replication initiation timing
MITEKIQRFRTVDELQKFLEDHISELKKSSEEASQHIGEKMRSNESGDPAELQELKQKLEGNTATDSKKKKEVRKSTRKRDQKNNWYNFDAISIYDGMGIKGELELYFKAMEMAKSELDRVTKIKQAVDDLVNKGLKRDLGCVLVLNHELPAEIAFTSSTTSRKKYSFKAIFNVPVEEPYEIQI